MIEISADKNFDRLDVFLVEKLDITRSNAQKLIKSGLVDGADGKRLRASTTVLEGQNFIVEIPVSPNSEALEAEDIDFDVIYSDEHLMIINKPARLVVHPAPGNWHGTLVNGLVYRFPEMRKLTNRMRPGIVHRLDSGTSGLMVVAKTQNACVILQKMFLKRTVKKKYLALTHNSPERHEGILSGPLERDPDNFMKMAIIEGGKPSLTGYKVLWSMNNFSLIECNLFTGRTHQIRAHMAALGCPLIGDNIYGKPSEVFNGRIYLHSWKLEFTHPITKIDMAFRLNVPEDFIEKISEIKAINSYKFSE